MALKKLDQQTRKFVVWMALLLGAVALAVIVRAKKSDRILYEKHMDDWAYTVDGTKYQVRDLAVYLAYQEQEIESQAKVYDLNNTNKYWNAHTNGQFIRVAGKDAALNMAVHDVIFCSMAQEEGMVLTKEETVFMDNQKMDFWCDLEEEGQERLGVSMQEIDEQFMRMALAQKQQQTYADKQGVDYREYNINGSLYKELLKEHTYDINKKLWKKLNFGNITIN